ncbi:MAG: polymerase, sigma-24 subunit, subfamily [Segetibacter sp.]|nr:polymerase, sigma-24 subunit, subfamily [Segetibacter sp.]
MLAKKLSTEEQLDDKVLLQEIVRGDYKAFTRLYETHVAQLTNYAFKFTDDLQIIEDSIHDIFVWLWNNPAQLEIIHSIKAYLLKSVRTSILLKIQKYKKIVLFEEPDEKEASGFFISGEEEYIDTESYFILKEKMTTVLSLLTSKQKEVIYLRFYQGLSFDQIAENMNLSTKACYKLMGRAISELRKICSHSWQS